eukprot:SM000065S20179  [mRNA]  locus=s65:105230:108649:- [translate_table: standard]
MLPGLQGLNLQNQKLLNLIGAFTTILQYNGPLQDYISYGVLGGACPAFSLKKNLQSYSRYGIGCLTAGRYDALANFASFTGSKMVFGVNVLAGLARSTKGTYTGTWNPANALLLLQYSKMKNYGIYGYSLGYEEAGTTNATISATSYAKYIMTFRTAIDTVYPTGPRPLLIGPNIQGWNLAYAQQLLSAVGQQLDVFGYHSTVLGTGTSATLAARAVDKAFLDKADATFASAKAATSAKASPWVTGGRGALSQSGSSPATSTFLSGFWYLHELGSAAINGQQAYCRETVSQGSDSILDPSTLNPRPDYYSALLFRRLMGSTVLASSLSKPASNNVRSYAHCLAKSRGGVAVLLINYSPRTAYYMSFPFAGSRVNYLLTAPSRSSPSILLNGAGIRLGSGNSVPPLKGATVAGATLLYLPASSYGFFTYPNANLVACGGTGT